MAAVKIRNLYISSDHNFFGRYGKKAETNPTVEVDEIECVAGKGIQGDRFFEHKENYKGQITFFAFEVYRQLSDTLKIEGKSTGVFRRNVITEGVDLNEWVGKEFEIQGVQFLGTEECSPCFWMNEAFGEGAEAFLKGQGGLRARILTSGALTVDK